MPSSIDDLFKRISMLSTSIANLAEGDPERRRLERDRDRLRIEATKMAHTGRHPESVRLEIQAIENRLAEIERMKITEGYQERRGGKNIQDPGAYSAGINQTLDEQHAEEVAGLTDRLDRLRSFVEHNSSS